MDPIVENLLVSDMEAIVTELVPLFAQFVVWVSVAVFVAVLTAAFVGLVNARRRLRAESRAHTPGAAIAFGARRREAAAHREVRVLPLHAMRPGDLHATLRN